MKQVKRNIFPYYNEQWGQSPDKYKYQYYFYNTSKKDPIFDNSVFSNLKADYNNLLSSNQNNLKNSNGLYREKSKLQTLSKNGHDKEEVIYESIFKKSYYAFNNFEDLERGKEKDFTSKEKEIIRQWTDYFLFGKNGVSRNEGKITLNEEIKKDKKRCFQILIGSKEFEIRCRNYFGKNIVRTNYLNDFLNKDNKKKLSDIFNSLDEKDKIIFKQQYSKGDFKFNSSFFYSGKNTNNNAKINQIIKSKIFIASVMMILKENGIFDDKVFGEVKNAAIKQFEEYYNSDTFIIQQDGIGIETNLRGILLNSIYKAMSKYDINVTSAKLKNEKGEDIDVVGFNPNAAEIQIYDCFLTVIKKWDIKKINLLSVGEIELKDEDLKIVKENALSYYREQIRLRRNFLISEQKDIKKAAKQLSILYKDFLNICQNLDYEQIMSGFGDIDDEIESLLTPTFVKLKKDEKKIIKAIEGDNKSTSIFTKMNFESKNIETVFKGYLGELQAFLNFSELANVIHGGTIKEKSEQDSEKSRGELYADLIVGNKNDDGQFGQFGVNVKHYTTLTRPNMSLYSGKSYDIWKDSLLKYIPSKDLEEIRYLCANYSFIQVIMKDSQPKPELDTLSELIKNRLYDNLEYFLREKSQFNIDEKYSKIIDSGSSVLFYQLNNVIVPVSLFLKALYYTLNKVLTKSDFFDVTLQKRRPTLDRNLKDIHSSPIVLISNSENKPNDKISHKAVQVNLVKYIQLY